MLKKGDEKCQSCPWRNLISFKHFSFTLALQFLGGDFQNQGNHVTSFELILRFEKYVSEVVSLFFCVLSYFLQFANSIYELRVNELWVTFMSFLDSF